MLCHPAFFLITRKLARRNRVSCSQPRHVFHTGNFVPGKPSRTRRPPTLAGSHVSGIPETWKRTALSVTPGYHGGPFTKRDSEARPLRTSLGCLSRYRLCLPS